MRLALICLWMLFFGFSLEGQEAPAEKQPRWSVEAGSTLSWSGVDASLRASYRSGPHEVFLGPRILLTDAYLPLDGPWGLTAGYRHRLLKGPRLASFVSAAYKVVFSRPYDPQMLGGDFLNSIQEWHLSYGFQWTPAERIGIGTSFGGGFYLEGLTDIIESKKRNFFGYSSQFQLFVSYAF